MWFCDVLCAAGVYRFPCVHACGPLQFRDFVCKCGGFCSIDVMAYAVDIFAVFMSQPLAWLFRARHAQCNSCLCGNEWV